MGRTPREDPAEVAAILSGLPLPEVVEVAVLSDAGDAAIVERVTAVISPPTITLRPIEDIQGDVLDVLGDEFGREFNEALSKALDHFEEQDSERELYELFDRLVTGDFEPEHQVWEERMPKIEAVLRLLAACENENVRAAVAFRDETPAVVIELLVNDEDAIVQANALLHFSTPAERLHTAIQDEIARDQNCDIDFLMEVLAHPNLAVEDGRVLFTALSPEQLVKAFEEDEDGSMSIDVYNLALEDGVLFTITEAALYDHPGGDEVDADTWAWYEEQKALYEGEAS